MNTNRPLASLKILDFSTLLPGPYATMMLADMGAEVLRVESPTRPDLVRSLKPIIQGESASHHYLNRNKRSLALDLKQPEAIEAVKKLVNEYDVVIEQFRPGVMSRLGLGYEDLKAINPKLIYCSITGYGQTGPYRDRAGHDLNYLAISGAASYTGRKDDGALPLGIQLADVAGGSHHAVIGILAAETQRQATGVGQFIDISMTDAAFAMTGMAGAGALANGENPEREEDLLNGGCFYDHYRTLDNKFISVGGLEPPFVKALSHALEKSELLELSDLHNSDVQKRLKPQLKDIFSSRDLAEWTTLFAEIDACVEPVLTVTEASEHPQIQAREMIIQCKQADGSSIPQAASPIKFSASQQQSPKAAPGTGKHSRQVLNALGYDNAKIESMIARNITIQT